MLKRERPIRILLSLLAACLLFLLGNPAAPTAVAAAPTAVAAAAIAAAPPPGLKMEAIPAFGGHFKYGEWLPVWVYLENSGPDLDAEVRIRVAGSGGATTFAAPVSLPAGSRKRVPVYVLPNNFARLLQVQLVDGQESILLTQEAQVKPQANINLVIGLIAPERGALSMISGASVKGIARPNVLIDLPLVELPDRAEGLRSFDCLILNDVDTSTLTPAQKAALESWVRQGGRLVIGGGAGARRTASGLPESLLSIVPAREVEVDALPGLASLGGGEAVRVPGPFLVSVGDLREGRTLAAQGSIPLVRERSVGDGYVNWVALDLATSPFDAWAGAISFWAQLIVAHAGYPQGMPPDMSPRQMRSEQMGYALSNLPSLALPSVKGLAILLGAYILLVGPLNYLILRWRRRLQWAWATIPLITLFFSGGAFGLGYALRGTDLILNKIAIVVPQPDGTAWVDAYVGLFSPARQSYEIEVRGSGLISSLNLGYDPFGSGGNVATSDVVFVQGSPARDGWFPSVRGLAVNQWSMQTFMTEEVWPDLGQVSGDLWFQDGALVGTVRNQTALTLKDVVVVMGMQFVRLGDLAPGAASQVRLELSNQSDQFFGPPISYRLFEKEFNQPSPVGPPRDIQLKQQILDNLLNTGGKFGPASSMVPMSGASRQELMLLAWLDRSPPEVRVAGRELAQQTTALLYMPLTYRLAQVGESGQGTISVPAGFTPGRIVEIPVEGGQCGPPGMPSIYIGRGDAVFEFQLPQDVRDIRVHALTLAVRTDGGWVQAPDTAIYDWATNKWFELEKPVVGDNVIESPAGMVGEDGLVRVRLSSDGSQGGCFYLGLGFEGTKGSD